MVAISSSFTRNANLPMPGTRKAATPRTLDAFNELVLEHQDAVFRQALWILNDEAAAQDATQEAFLRAYHAWHTYDGGPFRPWIMRIATNYCLDQLRRFKAHPKTSLEIYTNDDEEIECPAWMNDPNACVEEIYERSELRARIMQSIRRLAPEYRLPVIMIDLQEMDYAEAAATLGIPLGTFKSRLARARQKLQKWLQ
jgi:RNA polymerase sigma-70 factor, ECF subfamily